MGACSQGSLVHELSDNDSLGTSTIVADNSSPVVSDAEYSSLFESYIFDSVEDMYLGFHDIDEGTLDSIRRREGYHIDSTRRRTRVTREEQNEGIFGHMRNRLLREGTLMVPFYQGEQLPLRDREGFANITVFESMAVRKPWIVYHGLIDDEPIFFETMYYDRSLMDEANEKGASWLLSQINPDGTNVYNFEENQIDGMTTTVYEREISLGDRNVLAMASDAVFDDGEFSTIFYFVYDDILVIVWRASPDFLEAALPYITFQEVDFSTNKPLRTTPGRKGTRFSTRNRMQNESDQGEDNNTQEEFVE